MRKFSLRTLNGGIILAAVCLAGQQMPAQAQGTFQPVTVFQDEFNASSLNTSKWGVYSTSQFLQRTQYGLTPTIVTQGDTNFARLRLDTYTPDPAYRGTYVKGTEIFSKQNFTLSPGLEFETRIRGANLPRGLVFAFFTLGERGVWPTTYFKEEIDYEFLTNFNKNQAWLNVWDNWNPNRGGPNQESTNTANFDWSGWNVYKIRWLNDRVEWLINDVVVRTSTDILPDNPMQLHFNIWAASSTWSTAYDADLKPATTDAANQAYYMDVDYIRVRTANTGPNRVAGTGDGLQATYYNNSNFTGSTVSRIDPRINFQWGASSPDYNIDNDTFSARWTGFVEPQFTETFRFYTRTDDGVRLWVNNQLLIDQWRNRSVTENSADIALEAGKRYAIRMEYYENTGSTATAQLSWSSSSLPKQLVPQSQLYSAAETTDTTRPTAAITSPNNTWSYAQQPFLSGTASDTGGSNLKNVSVALRRASDSNYWNGTAWQTAAATFAATGTDFWDAPLPTLPDDSYTATATALDNAGNSFTTGSVQFYVDTTAPTLSVFYPFNNAVQRAFTDANGSATDSSGVASVTGRLYRVADARYWNGTAWVAASTDLPANATPPAGANWKFNFPTLPDGRYTYTAIAADFAGNIRTATPVNFTVDNTPDTTRPTAAISNIVNNGSYSNLPTVTGSASDSGGSDLANVRVSLRRDSDSNYWNGTAWQTAAATYAATGTTSWSATLPALVNGTHTISATATDGAGNSFTTAPIQFFIDRTAPTLSVFYPFNNAIQQTFTDANGSATDNVGVATVTGRLYRVADARYWNGTAWVAAVTALPANATPPAGANWKFNFPSLTDGRYTYTAIATDFAGNVGSATPINFTVGNTPDTIKPTAAIFNIVNNGSYNKLPTVTGSASDTGGSNLANVRVSLRRNSDSNYWNGTAWQTAATTYVATGTTSWSATLPALVNGTHTISATATDGAGNSFTTAPIQFYIDRTAPQISIFYPANNSVQRAYIDANGVATDAVGVSKVVCTLFRVADSRYWNGTAWVATEVKIAAGAPPTAGTNWRFLFPSLPDGRYIYTAIAVDFAGNARPSTPVNFTVDNTPDTIKPTAAIFNIVNNGSYNKLPTVTGSASDTGGSNLANVRVSLRRNSDSNYWNGTAWQTAAATYAATGTTNWSAALPALVNGTHTISATATDGVGNSFTTAPIQFYIDRTAPQISVFYPVNNSVQRTYVDANGVATDAVGVSKVVCTLFRVADSRYWNGTAWVATEVKIAADAPPTAGTNWRFLFPSLPDGRYIYTAIAVDFAGNARPSTPVNFTVDNTPDTIKPTAAIFNIVNNGSYNKLPTVTGDASDTGGSNLANVRVSLRRNSDSNYWNGTAWQTAATTYVATGTTSWSATLPALVNGIHTISATATDGAGNNFTTAPIQFYIDRTAPQISIFYPANNSVQAVFTDANGVATDAVGVSKVLGRLFRVADSRYWNGTTWVAEVTNVEAKDTPPAGTNWKLNFPSLTAGQYSYTAIGVDFAGNARLSTPVIFTVQGTAPRGITEASVPFSLATASAATQSIQLQFAGSLDAVSASNPDNFAVTVNGKTVAVESAAYSSASNTVTLTVVEGSFKSGDNVTAAWQKLRNAKQQPITGGLTAFTVN
jgi:hypothetical protein